MISLIAESKTMVPEVEVSAADYALHTPCGESAADQIMNNFAAMTAAEVAELTRLPLSLAAKMRGYAYEFPNKSMGQSAIRAFTGVVFKGLEFDTLSPQAADRCRSSVGIISSLYGWLLPEDIIKNYRLDFTSRLPLDEGHESTAYLYQKKAVTIALVKRLKETGENELLNLLPADAAKCVDWKLVKNFAKVWKVDFTDAATGKTPAAGRLKTLRGYLLRQILEEGIVSAQGLQSMSSDHYVCTGTPTYPDHLHFYC